MLGAIPAPIIGVILLLVFVVGLYYVCKVMFMSKEDKQNIYSKIATETKQESTDGAPDSMSAIISRERQDITNAVRYYKSNPFAPEFTYIVPDPTGKRKDYTASNGDKIRFV